MLLLLVLLSFVIIMVVVAVAAVVAALVVIVDVMDIVNCVILNVFMCCLFVVFWGGAAVGFSSGFILLFFGQMVSLSP